METQRRAEQEGLVGLSPIDYLKELTTPEGVRVIKNRRFVVKITRYDPADDEFTTSFMDINVSRANGVPLGSSVFFIIDENEAVIERTGIRTIDEREIMPEILGSNGNLNVPVLAKWIREQTLEEIDEQNMGRAEHFKKGRIISS